MWRKKASKQESKTKSVKSDLRNSYITLMYIHLNVYNYTAKVYQHDDKYLDNALWHDNYNHIFWGSY